MTVISLHAFLDRGGDLRALPFLDILAESIVVDRRLRSEPWLREAADSFRRLAGTMLDDPERHDLATLLLWEAEAYENEDVAARFEQALPRHKLEELLTGTQDARHPHRLMVTGVEWFTCGACGDDYDEALAVVVDGTEGITYCSACIGLASLALGHPGRRLGDDGPGSPAEEPAREAVGAGPGPARPGHRLRAPVAFALLAAVLIGSSGLASAGALPHSLQTVAHETLAFVGIDVPPGGTGDGACPRSGCGIGADERARARRARDGNPGGTARPPSPDRTAAGGGEEQRGATGGREPAIGVHDRPGEPGGGAAQAPAGPGETPAPKSAAPATARSTPATTTTTAGPTTTVAIESGTMLPPASTTTTTALPPPTSQPVVESPPTTTSPSTTTTTERAGNRRNGLSSTPAGGASLPDAAPDSAD